MLFAPMIFVCLAQTGACENVPEKVIATTFGSHAACMEFVTDQAPKVVAKVGQAEAYVAVMCGEIPPETCRLDRRRGEREFGERARVIGWRIEPYARGGADCTRDAGEIDA